MVMGRAFIAVAIVAAGAISIAIAFQSWRGTGSLERNAEPAGAATSDSSKRDSFDGVQKKSTAVTAEENAPEGFASRDSIDAGSPSARPAAADVVSVPIVAAVKSESSGSDESAAAVSTPESSLTLQEVRDFFVSNDACLVLGKDASSRARCKHAAAVAGTIATLPKNSEDSWADGMEYELDRRMSELLDADDLRGLRRKEVRCNPAGCLIYLEGASDSWPGRFRSLTITIRNDRGIPDLNDGGKWPGANTWSHGVDDRAMVVLPR